MVTCDSSPEIDSPHAPNRITAKPRTIQRDIHPSTLVGGPAWRTVKGDQAGPCRLHTSNLERGESGGIFVQQCRTAWLNEDCDENGIWRIGQCEGAQASPIPVTPSRQKSKYCRARTMRWRREPFASATAVLIRTTSDVCSWPQQTCGLPFAMSPADPQRT